MVWQTVVGEVKGLGFRDRGRYSQSIRDGNMISFLTKTPNPDPRSLSSFRRSWRQASLYNILKMVTDTKSEGERDEGRKITPCICYPQLFHYHYKNPEKNNIFYAIRHLLLILYVWQCMAVFFGFHDVSGLAGYARQGTGKPSSSARARSGQTGRCSGASGRLPGQAGSPIAGDRSRSH